MESLTFCIGYRDGVKERFNNLLFTINWFHEMYPEAKFMLVEADDAPKIKDKLPDCVSYIFYEDSGPYNRSRYFNLAVKHAQTDLIACQDADCIVRKATFDNALSKLKNGFDFAIPYSYALNLSESLTDVLIKTKLISRRESNLPIRSLGSYGGICICNKEAYQKIGGHNENFVGWGCEDTEFFHRASNLAKAYKPTVSVGQGLNLYHMYHPVSSSDKYNARYTKNRELMNTIMNLSNTELLAYVNENLKNG